MRLSSVIATLTNLLAIIVLDSIVFTLSISSLDAGSANSNGFAFLCNSRGLVNAL
jgi:hypothetical protein